MAKVLRSLRPVVSPPPSSSDVHCWKIRLLAHAKRLAVQRRVNANRTSPQPQILLGLRLQKSPRRICMLYDAYFWNGCQGTGGGQCDEFSVAKRGWAQGTGLLGLGWFVSCSCCFDDEILGRQTENSENNSTWRCTVCVRCVISSINIAETAV
jgi:hypothetical protein